MKANWTHLGVEDTESAHDDHRGTEDDMDDQRSIDHRIGHLSWRFLQHVVIDRFDTKTSTDEIRPSERAAKHTDLCAGGPSMMILIQRICMGFNGFGK